MPRSIAPTRAARHLALAALLVLAAGCRSSTGDEPLAESAACPQTFEFGNHGCARLVVVFEQPAAPLPSAYIYDVRAVSARGRDQGAPEGLAPNPAPGAVPLQLTLWQRLPEAAGDTVSMWIT
ncbi:MAG TPA: hypothetical protein VEX86_05050, partial [Longimicrobium sp.]|nr:hypothetical protein [Longimicrobium sp.]